MKMTTTDNTPYVEVWMGIKNYVPVKDQRQCAEQFIGALDDSGLVDFSEPTNDLYGICDVFDSALKIYQRDNGYDEMELEDWEE